MKGGKNAMSVAPERWKKLSSRVILDHPQLKVLEDIVLLPNGQKMPYVRRAPAAVHAVIAIAVNAKGELLLQREYSYPADEIMWQLPGGSMKANESPQAAALRELSEESGLSAKSTEIIGSFYVNNRLYDKKQYIVHCSDITNRNLPEDDDEFIESMWLAQNKIHDMIVEGKFDNINLLAALNIWFHHISQDR